MPFSAEKLAKFYRDNSLANLRNAYIANSDQPRMIAGMEFDCEHAPLTTMRKMLIASGFNSEDFADNGRVILAMRECGTIVHGCADFPKIILTKYLMDICAEPVRMVDAKAIDANEHIAPPTLSGYADRIVAGMRAMHRYRAQKAGWSSLHYLLEIEAEYAVEILTSCTAIIRPVEAIAIDETHEPYDGVPADTNSN